MSNKAASVASAANTNGSAAPSGGNGGNPAANSNAEHNTIVLEYLLKRGYHGAASALRHELEGTGSGQQQQAAGRAVPQETFTTRNLGGSGPSGQGNKRGGAGGAGGGLAGIREDPAPFRDGLMGLREFVFGSLDIHRPELLPILLPVFVHSYLDLVILSYRDQAESIFNTFSTDYGVSHPSLVRLLAACKTPPAIMEHEQAVRWRRERYIIRMTRRGWSLLLGWLQGGVVQAQGLSGAIGGHGAAASQETHERGREKMLGIINERVRVDIVDAKALAAHNRAVASGAHSASSGSNTITDGGLESELVVDATADASTAIASTSAATPVPPLKLGPMPADPKLDREVQRILSSEAARPQANGTLHLIDSSDNESKPSTSTLSPIAQSDLPPYPPSFRTVDVRREVEKVREARKRIRLGPLVDDNSPRALVSSTTDQSQARFSLPSVCMFTVHDSGDTLTATEFSDDSTLLAAGFSESHIRLWNLKGERMPGIRSDFIASDVTTSRDLQSLKENSLNAPTSRKLVGHSGPVYSMSFDPLPGPSGPPKYLLSASQDTSVRLWSMESYSTIVSYRGHRDPVWDVEWGPRGVYFATASRDRTARLWTTERVAAVRIFAGHLSDVDCVRFHPNTLYLATGSSDRTCRLWDVQKGSCVRVFVGHAGPVSAIALSPDGRYLASSGDDLNVNLWDLGSGRLVKSMAGHSARVHTLNFSVESSLLVSGAADCTMKVWDVLSAHRHSLGSSQGGSTANGTLGKRGNERVQDNDGSDLLLTLPTKRTPIFTTKFTPRNLCLAAGPIF